MVFFIFSQGERETGELLISKGGGGQKRNFAQGEGLRKARLVALDWALKVS